MKRVLLLGAGYVSGPVIEYLTRDAGTQVTVGMFPSQNPSGMLFYCSVEITVAVLKSPVIFGLQLQICCIRLRTWQPSTPTPSPWCWTSPARKDTSSLWSKTTTSSSGITRNFIHFIIHLCSFTWENLL